MRGGFPPLTPGCPWGAAALLSAHRLRYSDTPGTKKQSGTFPRPLRRNRSSLSLLSAQDSWALPLPTAGSGTECLEPFITSAWGLAGEGSAWHGATSPIAGNRVLGEGTATVPMAASLPRAMQRATLSRAAVLPRAPGIPCCQPTLWSHHLTPVPWETKGLHVCTEPEAGKFTWKGKNLQKKE